MPINKKYKINELFEALRYYIKETNRRITIEYILINDLNDTVECANELAELRGMNAYINLIPYNEKSTQNEFKRSTLEHRQKFYDTLKKREFECKH